MDTHKEFFTGRIGLTDAFTVVLQFYGYGPVLRISIGSFTGMEYSLLFCVF
jgi:hypothetical protein